MEGALRPPNAVRPTDTIEQRLTRLEAALTATPPGDRLVGDLRGELAEVASAAERRAARVMNVVGELEKRLEQVEARVEALVSSATASWRAELRDVEHRLQSELASVAPAPQPEAPPVEDLQLLVERLGEIEQVREEVTAQLRDVRESTSADAAALNDRLAELAAQLAAPAPLEQSGDGADDWPSVRAYVQLRVAVEGLQMRLAYHEKEVAELVGGRGINERIAELNELLGRLETVEQDVRGERDSVLGQIDRLASHVDYRLNKLETTPITRGAETG